MYGGADDGYLNNCALVYVNNGNVTFTNSKFAYTNGGRFPGSGIWVNGSISRANIANNEFSDCGTGLSISGTSTAIQSNHFINNYITGLSCGADTA